MSEPLIKLNKKKLYGNFGKPAVLTTAQPQVRSEPDPRALRRLSLLDKEIAEARQERLQLTKIREEAMAAVIAEDEAAKQDLERSGNLMLKAANHLSECEAAIERAREAYEVCQALHKNDTSKALVAGEARDRLAEIFETPKIAQLQKREENLQHRRAIHVSRHGLQAGSNG